MISFVKDGSVFQVIRIKPGKLITPLGGEDIDRYPSAHSRTSSTSPDTSNMSSLEPKPQGDAYNKSDIVGFTGQNKHASEAVRFKIGGRVQFGCVCSNGGPSYRTKHSLSSPSEDAGMYCSNSYYEKRLDFELFVDGESERLRPALSGQRGKDCFADISSKSRIIPLSSEKPTILVCVYSLREEPSESNTGIASTWISSPDMEQFLGIEHRSVDMTDRLWAACVLPNYDVDEADEVCAVARNVEEILCVSSVPISRQTKQVRNGCSTPSPEGASSQQQVAPLASTPHYAVALIRNIMTSQYVDLQSSL